jgi:ProP effector
MHASFEELPLTPEEMRVVLQCLCEWYPQTFTLKKYLSHRPLKIGIDIDLAARCPALSRRERCVILRSYVTRVMYLEACVAGAARIDLDGHVCGEVSAAEAGHAAARLADIMARRESKRAAAVEAHRLMRIAKQTTPSSSPPTTTPASNISPLKAKPLLTLPAFRRLEQVSRSDS